MAALVPIVARKILRRGKEVLVYRRGNRFVSKAAYRAQQWRLAGGKSGTRRKQRLRKSFDDYLRAELGAPSAGKQWVNLAQKYPERFEDYIRDFNERFGR